MIPTVELSQKGGAVKRARGRPRGVIETAPRKRGPRFTSESAEVRRLKAAQDAAIRARRKPYSVQEDDVLPPQPLMSFGNKTQRLPSYAMPDTQEEPSKTKSKGLSPQMKDRLKKGLLAAIAAGVGYYYREEIASTSGDLGRKAVAYIDNLLQGFDNYNDPSSPTSRSSRQAVQESLSRVVTPDPSRTPSVQFIEDDTDYSAFQPTFQPRNTARPSAPPLFADLGSTPGRIDEIFSPATPNRRSSLSPERQRNIKSQIRRFRKANPDIQGILEGTTPVRRSTRKKNPSHDTGMASARTPRKGRGIELDPDEVSPCEHMKQAGRQVFDMAEMGDKKRAKKEIKELKEHLSQIKEYVASL